MSYSIEERPLSPCGLYVIKKNHYLLITDLVMSILCIGAGVVIALEMVPRGSYALLVSFCALEFSLCVFLVSKYRQTFRRESEQSERGEGVSTAFAHQEGEREHGVQTVLSQSTTFSSALSLSKVEDDVSPSEVRAPLSQSPSSEVRTRFPATNPYPSLKEDISAWMTGLVELEPGNTSFSFPVRYISVIMAGCPGNIVHKIEIPAPPQNSVKEILARYSSQWSSSSRFSTTKKVSENSATVQLTNMALFLDGRKLDPSLVLDFDIEGVIYALPENRGICVIYSSDSKYFSLENSGLETVKDLAHRCSARFLCLGKPLAPQTPLCSLESQILTAIAVKKFIIAPVKNSPSIKIRKTREIEMDEDLTVQKLLEEYCKQAKIDPPLYVDFYNSHQKISLDTPLSTLPSHIKVAIRQS